MYPSNSSLHPHDPAELARAYTRGIRALDICSVLTYFGLMVVLAASLWPHACRRPGLVLSAIAAGYLAADFVSGFVHWLADTWGSVDMPVIGKALLRPFREHHIDQLAITHHDFVETNGNNCLISIPTIALALLLKQGPGHPLHLFLSMFLGWMVFWVMATNQFHKWAHLPKPGALIATLQKLHLILAPAHHVRHHTSPFSSHYCITTGWLNYPLTWMRFFPVLEWMVTSLTGMIPRADDLGSAQSLSAQAQAFTEKLP